MIQLEVLSPSYNKLSAGSSVPIGQRGLVHVWGKNDMATSQVMLISWVVKDPDGITVEEYADDAGTIGAEKDHEFIGGRFDLDKVGTYTIAIKLFMDRDAQVLVASYEGALCTTTTEVPPEYEEIQHTVYPYAYIYDGDVEVVAATFKTDPFTPSAWIAEKVAKNLADEVRKEGGRLIEMRAYADTKPLFWTNIRIDIISTPLRETAGGAPRQTAIPLWAAILIIALAIIAVIIVATLAFNVIMDRFEHKPISEKIKKTWSKPTLIGAVSDFEIELELPPTPPAELEGMSEQELRDYCDMLAEEIAPPGVSWLPWAIGAGALVIGTATVLAVRKKK